MKPLKGSDQSITLEQAKQDYNNFSGEVQRYLQEKFGKEAFNQDWFADYKECCSKLGYTPLTIGDFNLTPIKQRERVYYRHVLATIIEYRNGDWVADITDYDQKKWENYLYHDKDGFRVCSWYSSYGSGGGGDLQMRSQELAEELKESLKDLWIKVLA